MSTSLVNFQLANGETHQFLMSEYQATYEPGETLPVKGRQVRIVRKSTFVVRDAANQTKPQDTAAA